VSAVVKAVIASAVGGGILIASFYIAYLLLFIVAVGLVGGLAYLFFNWREVIGKQDFFD